MASSSQEWHDFNIVLLGESRHGKSTFINSLANYLKYDSYEQAKNAEDFSCLIPATGTIKDAHGARKSFECGSDPNESKEMVRSGTLSCKSHVLSVDSKRIRLIDSAGIGAAEGVDADDENLDDVFDYICELENLHAIAIFLTANQTKLDAPFKYCMDQILSKLSRTAVQNLIFIVTFCGQSEIQVFNPLEAYLKEIEADKGISIQLTEDRVFEFDNCAFQYILAERSGIELPRGKTIYATEAYSESVKESQRLLRYVLGDSTTAGLTPHNVKQTKKLKKARNFIKAILPLIDEILNTIETNQSTYKDAIERQKIDDGVEARCRTMSFKARCTSFEQKFTGQKRRTATQLQDIAIVELKDAQTVCMSVKCRKECAIRGEIKYLYPQICCNGCSILGGVFSRRLFCSAFGLYSGRCKIPECQCHVSEHDRRYYKTEKIMVEVDLDPQELEPFEIENEEQLSAAEQAQKQREHQHLEYLNNQHNELMVEKVLIEHAVKMFDLFLKINSISGSSRNGRAEYERMADREDFSRPQAKHVPTSSKGKPKVESQKQLTVTAAEILQIRQRLFNLPKYGDRIRLAWSIAKKGKAHETQEMAKKESVVQVNVKAMAKHFQWLQDNL